MNTKAQQIAALEQEIIEADVCSVLAAQATQLVMGSGDTNAKIVLVGEAPGKKEDESGVPFVGASGTLLDSMLEAAGMQRSDVYITNIVKYRPPDNRDPSAAEKAAFLPYLLRQIEIIAPKVVVTLGRHSMECFLPGAKIAQVHGSPTLVTSGSQTLTLLPLYHPAAALYSGKLRQTLMDDFMTMTRVVASL